MTLKHSDVERIHADAAIFLDLAWALPVQAEWALRTDGVLVAVCQHADGDRREVTADALRVLAVGGVELTSMTKTDDPVCAACGRIALQRVRSTDGWICVDCWKARGRKASPAGSGPRIGSMPEKS